MSELFNFDGFMEDDDHKWIVPEYLRGLYTFWTLTGQVTEQLNQAHYVAEHSEPKDTIMEAFLDAPCDLDEDLKSEAGLDHIVAHDLLVAAEGALRLLTLALTKRLGELDALPPWWSAKHDAVRDRPLMGWELQMLRDILEADDDDEPTPEV